VDVGGSGVGRLAGGGNEPSMLILGLGVSV